MNDQSQMWVDPDEAREHRRSRERLYHTREVPALRAIGMALVVMLGLLHNVYLLKSPLGLAPFCWFAVGAFVYSAASWLILKRWHGRTGRLDLGTVFLALDLVVWSWAVWVTGGDRSRLFFLFFMRVADQATTNFRRVMRFAHLAAACYAAVLLLELLVKPSDLHLAGALSRIALVYFGNVYIAMTARTAEGLHKRTARAVHLARKTIARLWEQSDALKRAQTRAEEASRTKSAFLANMSHEIRTPMTAIQGYTELLLEGQLGEGERECVNVIQRNSNHLLSLLNDILDLSKIEAGKLEIERLRTSLPSILADVASLMRARAAEKGLELCVEYATPVPETILTDPTRLRQILMNLVGNAIKFTAAGSVRLIVRCEDAAGGARITVDVIDTGIGMTAQQLGRLFEPFVQGDASTTRTYGGSGLGLVISQRLAKALGGGITVSSVAGQGSSFSVAIETGPLEGVTQLVTLREAGTPPPKRAVVTQLRGRVLLAEDGIDNQVLISSHLRKAGLEVTVVEDGQLAVDKALGSSFDVVLMDMQMPRMDGYTAATELRKAGYRGPIVALTAHAMSGDRKRCLQAGCDEYLTKPVERVKLYELLRQYLAERSDEESAPPLTSEMADDPEMADLITMFVAGLGARIVNLRQALDAGDAKTLARLAHQIRGAAGGYGFPSLTTAAATLEDSLHEASTVADASRAHAEALMALLMRAHAGTGPTLALSA